VAQLSPEDEIEDSQATGESGFGISLGLSAPGRVSLGGSLSAAGGEGHAIAFVSLDAGDTPFEVETSDGGAPLALDVEESGSVFLNVGCFADVRFGQGEPAVPSAQATFDITLTVTVEEEGDSDVFVWVGGPAGAFGDPENWDPEGPATSGVPTFVAGERSDTAVFDRGNVRVDVAGGAASLGAARGGAPQCAGPIGQSAGRMVVHEGAVELLGAPLALDDLSLDEPSLTLLDGALLDLDQVALCARHARIGAGGRRSIVLVAGPGGVLQTLGRLSVGGTGEGLLRFNGGGIGSSEEVRIGDGRPGSAAVSNATWQTGSLAVGFQSSGELTVENAGLLEAEGVFVDRDLDPLGGQTAALSVRGAGSMLRTERLVVEGRGTVRVEDAGRLEVLAAPVAEPALLGDEDGLARLFVNEGGELVAPGGMTVGALGPARVVVAEEGPGSDAVTRLDVGGLLQIGVPEFDGIPAGTGEVVVLGDPASGDELTLVSNALDIGDGRLEAQLAGKLLTAADARIGVAGVGTAAILGGGGNPPETFTSWQISGSLAVGGPSVAEGSGALEIRDAGVFVGSPGSPGSVLIGPGGVIGGTGTRNLLRLNGGLVTNHGVIATPLDVDGRYDAASTGSIVAAVSGAPLVPRLRARSPDAAFAALAGVRRKPKPLGPAEGPLVVSGDAGFAGTTLVLRFRNGFAPAQGDVFRPVEVAGAVNGNFADVVVEGLAPGFDLATAVVDGAVTVTSLNDATALPAVTLKAKRALKEKKSKKGTKVSFKRSGDKSQPLLVAYALRGSARNGLDYETLPGTLEIPAGKKSAKLSIRPIRDGLPEGPETIELELLSGTGYGLGAVSKVAIELSSSE
jgi:hypothetical protein